MRYMCFCVLLMLAGCFALVQGTRDRVKFFSEPPGATVTMAGKEGITPCVLEIRRGRWPQMITFKLSEHETLTHEIVSVDGARWNFASHCAIIVDLLLFVPGVVDLATGIAYGWPYEIHAKLPPKEKGTATINVVRSKPRDWSKREGTEKEPPEEPRRFETIAY